MRHDWKQVIHPAQSTVHTVAGYTKCADEQGICSCSGLVQYGVGNAWTTPRAINGQIVCSNNQFGDPKQGKVKACYCLAGAWSRTLFRALRCFYAVYSYRSDPPLAHIEYPLIVIFYILK